MSDPSNWTVRELKVFLHSNGISTAGLKDKSNIISLASNLLQQQQRVLYNKVITAVLVIAITAVLLHIYVRPKVERYFWLNPKWVGSYILMSVLFAFDKLLTINVILSWIVPANMKEYNLIDYYVVGPLKLFPLCVPLNIDQDTGEVLMWLDLYPMLLIWSTRYFTRYWTLNHHYMWYDQYQDGYYDAYPDAVRPDLNQMMNRIHHELNALPNFEVELDRDSESLSGEELDYQSDHGQLEGVFNPDCVVEGDQHDVEEKDAEEEGNEEDRAGFAGIIDECHITPTPEFDEKLQRALSELLSLHPAKQEEKAVESEE